MSRILNETPIDTKCYLNTQPKTTAFHVIDKENITRRDGETVIKCGIDLKTLPQKVTLRNDRNVKRYLAMPNMCPMSFEVTLCSNHLKDSGRPRLVQD